MGKKNKGWEEGAAGDYLGVSTKSKLAKKYGVKGATGGGKGLEMQGLSGTDYRSDDDVKRDIAREMSNDYDVRRSLEAAGLAGDKKAAKLSRKGITNYNKVEKAWDYLAKLKKKHVGGGGMFGAENAASLTDAMVNWDRDEFKKYNDEKYATKDELSALEQMKAAQGGGEEETKELSKDIKDAQDRNALYNKLGGNIGGNPYGGGSDANESDYWGIGADDEQDASAVSPDDTDPYTKSQSYLDNYKDKLKSKGKFVSTF